MKQNYSGLLTVLGVAILASAFFYRTFLSGLLPVPADALVGLYHPWRDELSAMYPRGVPFKNYLVTDPVRQQIPWRKVMVDSVRKGDFPGWNPYAFAGTPLAGNIQAGTFYPLNLLFFLMPFSDAWSALIILQPVLASVFTYLYLRNLGLRKLTSVFGASVFAFCGFAVAWMTWGTIVHTALWLPVSLLSVDRMRRNASEKKRTFLWPVVLAASLTFSFFAGHAQVFLYTLLFVLAYATYRRSGILPKDRLRYYLMMAAALMGFILLSSPQWLAFIPNYLLSPRAADTTSWTQSGWFIPWRHLAQLLAPDYFGNPATLNYWGTWNYGEFLSYAGIIALVLAASAVLSRIKGTGFFVWIAGAALLFSVENPVSRLPFLLRLPVISSLQPTRLIIVVDFCLAVLAAYGFEQWLTDRRRMIPHAFTAVAFFLIFLWGTALYGKSSAPDPVLKGDFAVSVRNLVIPTAVFMMAAGITLAKAVFGKRRYASVVLGMILTGVSLIDLYRTGWKFTPFVSASYFFPPTQLTNRLKSGTEPFRIMSLDKRIIPPNTGAFYGIETIEGYDSVYDARYEKYMAAAARNRPDTNPPYGFNRIFTSDTAGSPLWPIANVRYVLSIAENDNPDLTEQARFGDVRLLEYRRNSPRVYLAGDITAVTEPDQAISVMYSDLFVPGISAVTERRLDLRPEPLAAGEHIKLASYSADKMDFDVNTIVPRLVVIVNAYHPNWRATVDGVPAQIIRVNYLFMGLVIPSGKHSVHIYYSGI